MLAYKFRGPDQLQFAFDIILNGRLYCADWSRLNDPMEGYFRYNFHDQKEEDAKREAARIMREKSGLRVCSLASTFESHLLWAHYAAAFTGMAIEVDIPFPHASVREIEYRDNFPSFTFPQQYDPLQAAQTVLSSKYNEWQYEREIRVLHPSDYFEWPNLVQRVIVGPRMEPALAAGLKIICQSRRIRLEKAEIHGTMITAMAV
jgi:hypothetical protein